LYNLTLQIGNNVIHNLVHLEAEFVDANDW